MQVYNPATNQTADVPERAFQTWAERGWLSVDEMPPAEDEAEDEDEGTAEMTAEDQARVAHPTARLNKDK